MKIGGYEGIAARTIQDADTILDRIPKELSRRKLIIKDSV